MNEIRALGTEVHCYCIMPYHIHLLMSISNSNRSISSLIHGLKYRVTKRVEKKLWQRSFYDHVIRPNEDVTQVCEYIISNPVAAGLTDDVGEWPYADMLDPLEG